LPATCCSPPKTFAPCKTCLATPISPRHQPTPSLTSSTWPPCTTGHTPGPNGAAPPGLARNRPARSRLTNTDSVRTCRAGNHGRQAKVCIVVNRPAAHGHLALAQGNELIVRQVTTFLSGRADAGDGQQGIQNTGGVNTGMPMTAQVVHFVRIKIPFGKPEKQANVIVVACKATIR